MPLRKPDIALGPFREQDTARLTMVFVDNTDTPIPGAALLTATLTLFLEDADEEYPIINNRDHVDILSMIDNDGLFTFELTSDDMVIVDDEEVDTPITEKHRALIEWTYPLSQRGSYEIRIVVSNLVKVPT